MTQLDEAHFHLHTANKDKMSNMNKFFANKNKKMLVDGDLLVYKITSSLEEPIDWGNDIWTLSSDTKIIKAFQRRFRQNKVNGQIDNECLQIGHYLTYS